MRIGLLIPPASRAVWGNSRDKKELCLFLQPAIQDCFNRDIMKRIILAEDDCSIQDTVRLILESAGYHVDIFSDGDLIIRNEFTVPDVFILDRQLPGIDGLDVCRFLKQNESTKDVPVIMLSANPMIVKLAKLAGADYAIEKPFRMKDLKGAVERLINLESL